MNIKKRNFVLVLLLTAILGVSAGAGGVLLAGEEAGVGEVSISRQEYQDLTYMSEKYAKAEELWEIVANQYYKELSDEDIEEGMYKGIFQGTGDVYSSYMNSEEWTAWQDSMRGEFEGVGITYEMNSDGNFVILSTFEDSPAEKGGLRKGDIILEVDGKTYDSLETVSTAIKGEAGTDVVITYMRDGKEDKVTLTRAKIVVESIESEIRDDGIGYIKISSFDVNTAADFKEALENMEKENVKSFILDLRDNGGGLVDEALEVADALIGEGTLLYTVDRQGEKKYYYSDENRTSLTYTVLVNENSASATEMLASAIKTNGAAKLVGTNTFGKGVIQVSNQLDDGSGYKVTIMEYFAADDSKIHEKGVAPDVKVEASEKEGEDKQLEEALKVLKDSK